MLAERVIFLPALPELFLAAAAMVLLLVGVFRGDGAARTVSWLAVGVLAVTGLLAGVLGTRADTALLGLFVTDAFAVLMKLLVLLGSLIAVIMAMDFNERERMARPEYPVLVLFATLGMMMMISANDLMSLYLGLELQSLSLYVLAAFQRDSVRSTEAGLKYFVLGALSSGMLLYGASLLYGFTGTTSFADIGDVLAGSVGEVPLGALFGLVFVTAGLAFKVSAAPFHMWTPDVYEGAPTPVTAFFAAAPKIAATALLVRVLVTPLGPLAAQWQQIVVAAAVLSMAVGALAAINQTNIKRLMAYSSIGHICFALIGLAAGDEVGVRGLIMYMAIYLVMNVAAFGVILCMRRQDRMVERIDDLAGLGRTRPMLALAMLVAMFSMAGIPPLAGFFGKLYVFNAAIQAGLYALAVFGVLASVVSAFYYLRVVKVMYFDEPLESFDRGVGRPMAAILVGATTFMVTFILLPLAVNIEGWVGSAAASLFPG